MPLAGTTFENQALTALSGTLSGGVNCGAYVSLHSATTGTTGTNEMTGGGYARQAETWNASSGGSETNSGALSYSTNGSTAVDYFGTFSAVTSGTFGIGGALSSAVTAATITVAAGGLTLSAS